MARKAQNVPCTAGCSKGLVKVKRQEVVTDDSGKRVSRTREVDELCPACDGSGYIRVTYGEGE